MGLGPFPAPGSTRPGVLGTPQFIHLLPFPTPRFAAGAELLLLPIVPQSHTTATKAACQQSSIVRPEPGFIPFCFLASLHFGCEFASRE